MNLQVNLIRPTEQRSASMVSLKSLGLIAVGVSPLILLLLLMQVYLGYTEAHSTYQLLDYEWEDIQDDKERAMALAERLKSVEAIHDEVAGWGRSRRVWHEFLGALQPLVPPVMQLRAVRMRQQVALGDENEPIRYHVVTLSGRCTGADAEERVETLRRRLATDAPFIDLIERAVVTVFGDDEAEGARDEDRVFEIELDFYPSEFYAASGE